MLWLGFALLAAVALAFVLWPLLRAQSKDMTRRSHDLAVYRAQLAEVTQDQDRGVLSENEAAAARLEIQRRLLRADEADANLSEARGRIPCCPCHIPDCHCSGASAGRRLVSRQWSPRGCRF